jgi:Transposase IS4
MPRCVLGDHCLHPQLDLRSGHQCRRCHHRVHVFCAEEDPHADASNNLTCFLCTIPPKIHIPFNYHPNRSGTSLAGMNIESNLQAAGQPSPLTLSDKDSPTGPSAGTRSTAKLKKAPQAKRKHPTTNPKTTAKKNKEFRLEADNSKPDPMLMKPVAFDVDDNLHGTRLYQHFGGDESANHYLTVTNSKRLLLGTIIRASKKSTKGASAPSTMHYDIQWERSDLPDTPVAVSLVLEAIALHQMISSRKAQNSSTRRVQKRDPFSHELRNVLLHVDDTERGRPESSDEDDYDDDDGLIDDNFLFFPYAQSNNMKWSVPITDEDEYKESGEGTEFIWSTGKLLPPPDCSKRRPSHVIPSLTGNFVSPISSFLAFIPLKIFNSIAHYTNLYAHQAMEKSENGHVSGKKWESDITINEMMKFFGILFKMVLRPTPGQSYPYCWSDTHWHPYTVHMRLRRFQQIRAVLHFNDNSNIEGSDDAAFKVSVNDKGNGTRHFL